MVVNLGVNCILYATNDGNRNMANSLKGWAIWIVVIVIASSIFSSCTSADRDNSGEVVDSGSVSAFEIKVGDCLTDTFGAGDSTFSETNAVPCNEPHAFEAYHSEYLSGDNFPADINTLADDICYYAFPDFVGVTVEETDLSYSSLLPTQNSWDQKSDREVTCLVGMYDGSEVTGTLRNSR